MPDEIAPCPQKPNCVCSRSDAPARRRVEPLAVSGDPRAAFGRLRDSLAAAPRTTLAEAGEDYLRAHCRSRLGFIDDLECWLREDEGVIHVRSASRVGYYDFGVNRRRVEALRRSLGAGG